MGGLTIERILEDFAALDEPSDRMDLLVEPGNGLPPFPAEDLAGS